METWWSRSRFGEKFVFVDHGCHGHFGICEAVIDAHNLALAAHADAFSKGDFRRKSKGELDRRGSVQRRIEIEADTARTHVPGLCRERSASVAGIIHRDRQA